MYFKRDCVCRKRTGITFFIFYFKKREDKLTNFVHYGLLNAPNTSYSNEIKHKFCCRLTCVVFKKRILLMSSLLLIGKQCK